jgi:RNA polymerase sigma-70 factor (ECF subfamily)
MSSQITLPIAPSVPEIAQDDAEVMAGARTDPTRFAEIYERYFRRIYLYCYRHVSNAEEAEDLASLVFVQAFRSIALYRGGSVSAWLFRIAYGTVANYYRSARAEVSIDAKERDMAADLPEPLERIMQAETHHALRALVDALPKEDRDLLLFKIDGGLSSQEIGELLGKSAGAVRIQLHRIIKQLRLRYQQLDERR